MSKFIKIAVLIAFGLVISAAVFAQEAQGTAPASGISNIAFKWLAAAIAVGLSTIAGGMAVAKVGAAAMAAMGENPDVAGKALPYVGLAEGICLWGFIVALMILFS